MSYCQGCADVDRERIAQMNRAEAAEAAWTEAKQAVLRLTRALSEAREATRTMLDAYDTCDANRGAFSCHDAHDLRCPKSRSPDGTGWRGEWVCECGREELEAALVRAREVLAQGDPT